MKKSTLVLAGAILLLSVPVGAQEPESAPLFDAIFGEEVDVRVVNVDDDHTLVEFSVSAVTSTMRALDVPEGRKAFLLLGGDWPTGHFRRERWGIGVRSRRGYLDLSRRAERDMDTLGRLLFPSTDLSPLHELRVDVGAIEKKGLRKMTVPVEVRLPVGVFPMLPYREQFLLRLELRFATVDRNGQQAVIAMIELELDARSRPPVHTLVSYETTLTMRRRPHMLAVTVTDPVTGQAASARFPIAPDMVAAAPWTAGGAP